MTTLYRLCHRPTLPHDGRKGKDSGNVFPHLGLLVFARHHIVPPCRPKLLGKGTWGEPGIPGHASAFEDRLAYQVEHHRHLSRLVGHRLVGQGRPAGCPGRPFY